MGRSSRGGGLGAMFSSIIKNEREWLNGRIHKCSSGYVYSDEGCINRQGFHLPAHLNKLDGQMISLNCYDGDYVNNCPEPPAEGYVNTGEEGKPKFWVPFKVCRKCPSYLKRATRGRPYAACQKLRERRTEHKPGEALVQVLAGANQKMAEFMGKGV